MWFGKMTTELEELYDQYYKQFGVEPDFYDELEYGENNYKDYIEDIKKAIKLNKELPRIN